MVRLSSPSNLVSVNSSNTEGCTIKAKTSTAYDNPYDGCDPSMCHDHSTPASSHSYRIPLCYADGRIPQSTRRDNGSMLDGCM